MALTLRILHADGPDPGLVLTLDAPRVVIGRGRGCEVLLPDPTVSSRHATIEQRGGKNVITDEGSTNGIVVGLDKLPPRTPQTLGRQETIRVGRVWLEIEAGLGTASDGKQTQAVARRLVARRLTAEGEPARPIVRVVAGPDEGAALELADADREYVIGRSKETDLCLGGDTRLSRRHLSVASRGGDWVVRDLGSKRGATLEGEPLSTEAVPWSDGSRVRFGDSVIELSDPVAAALPEILRAPDERMRPAEFEERPPGAAAKKARPEPPEDEPGAAEPIGEPASSAEGEPDDVDPGEEREPALAGRYDPLDDEDEEDELPPGPESHLWLETGVVLVALAVLGASVAGLVWLLGGG
ncbi:MAG: FHA domain-containing protein [Deltaproteobacteria bacterium]|jgi:pSer/pThr/pTyr-binding forkhead associated (FHA) protein|nr:FHA domain-containing protein [Deltaproteobacteria bacterium]MBW2535149.1 FHA domain-containing protein [Deltaproteobacteria bacterium]